MNPMERELAHVPRWCIVRTTRDQSVAEHAFFVARYVADICRAMGRPIKSELLQYALMHDDDELHTGDIPAPHKDSIGYRRKAYPAVFYELDTEDVKIVKIADLLEAALFLVDEQLMGNNTIGLVLEQLREQLASASGSMKTKDGMWLAEWLNLKIDVHQSYRGRIR